MLCAVALMSCNDKQVIFHQSQALSDDIQWNKSDIKTFEVDVKDNSAPLELIVHFRYATGYAYDKVKIRVTETAPNDERTITDLEIPVRDASGEFIGEKGYDIIDLDYPMDRNHEYQMHGKYTYTFEQAMPDIDPLHYAMELGLSVRRKEQ